VETVADVHPMPPWLTAKVESRLAELAFAAGLDPALLADKPIIMTTLTEPEEDTKEAVDVWERTCDKCGRYIPENGEEMFYTGQIMQELLGRPVLIMFGVCDRCRIEDTGDV